MKTHLIQIGNSKGIRIPKSIIEQYNISEEIELIPMSNGLLISSKSIPRKDWEELFNKALKSKNSPDISEWQKFPNRFEKEEWSW